MRRTLSDWVSPVVVKEVRQGLRSPWFLAIFLAFQACLVIGYGLVLARDDAPAREALTVTFWTIAVLAVGCLMPLRGLEALSSELKNRAFEQLMLTRLTAWRLVLGKWTSLVLLNWVVTSALFPYLILRYYLGGLRLLDEILILISLSVAAAALSAAALFLSSFQNWFIKVCMGVGCLWLVVMTAAWFENRHGAAHTPSGPVMLIAALLLLFLASLFFLQLAVRRFAPPAENHAWIRRALLVAFLGVAQFAAVDLRAGGLILALTLMMVVLGILETASEPFVPLASLYAPFAGGPVRRFLGRFVYPGWPSALRFFIVFIPAVALTAQHLPDRDPWWTLALSVQLFSLVLLPLAVTVAIPSLRARPGWAFLGGLGGTGTLLLLGIIILSVLDGQESVIVWASLMPPGGVVVALVGGNNLAPELVACLGLVSSVPSMLVLAGPYRTAWNEIRSAEARGAR